MKVEKGATGSGFLNAKEVISRRISKLQIMDEGERMEYPAKDGRPAATRVVLGVMYEGQREGDPSKWSLNNKSLNALIDIFGDDTEKWVDKTVEIGIAGEGDYKHIIVDTLRTCLLYTSPSPRDRQKSRMPSSA